MDHNAIHKANRDKLVSFFEEGNTYSRNLGFSLEHIVLHSGTGEAVSYCEPGGMRDVLSALAASYERHIYEGENLIGLANSCETILLGPGGQLKASFGPCASVLEIETAYLAFRNRIDPVLEAYNLETPMLGYNPAAKANKLEPTPSFRYQCLADYLGKEAYEGICMMRASAALHVSVNYENEADAVRKMRIAQIIAPILSLMCDNSPIFEREERKIGMVRCSLWTNMNQDRVGTIPGSLKSGFTFADYADYLLSRKAVLAPGTSEAQAWRFVGQKTFDELYCDREMTDAELEHALTMVWPDARIKDCLEIRPADAMPIEYCLAFAVLVRALFYSRRNLDVLESLLANIDESHVRQAKTQLMEFGYGAEIYGRQVEFWTDLLLVLASGTLEAGEAMYLEPLASMVRYRFTLAEIWPRLMEKRHQMPAGAPDAPIIGVVPRYDFEWTGLAVGDGYLAGLLETGAVPIVLPLTSDPQHIKRLVQSCNGFLIPGGQDIDPARYGARRQPHTHRSATSRDSMEQALIRAAVAADKPILGICRGMQSINVALGGTLHQDIKDVIPESDIPHFQKRPFDMPAHMVEVKEDSKLASLVGACRLGVNTIHHQSVATLGEGLVVSAISPDDGVIEGIEMPQARFVIGVQWHPEHMWRNRPHSKRLFRALVDACR